MPLKYSEGDRHDITIDTTINTTVCNKRLFGKTVVEDLGMTCPVCLFILDRAAPQAYLAHVVTYYSKIHVVIILLNEDNLAPVK